MSGNATLVERLRIGLMASAAFVRGNADAVSRMNDALDALDEVSVGIAELEAEREITAYDLRDLDACLLENEQLKARIAELEALVADWKYQWELRAHMLDKLEAERDRLQAACISWEAGFVKDNAYVELLQKRIAELEADAKLFVLLHALAIEQGYMPDPGESAYDLLQRAIMSGSPADTRTAVLAERQAIVTRLTELGVPQAFTDVLPIWLRRCL